MCRLVPVFIMYVWLGLWKVFSWKALEKNPEWTPSNCMLSESREYGGLFSLNTSRTHWLDTESSSFYQCMPPLRPTRTSRPTPVTMTRSATPTWATGTALTGWRIPMWWVGFPCWLPAGGQGCVSRTEGGTKGEGSCIRNVFLSIEDWYPLLWPLSTYTETRASTQNQTVGCMPKEKKKKKHQHPSIMSRS